MATIPPYDPNQEHPAMATTPPNSFKAEHEAAVTAYKEQIARMSPTRQEYDTLFFKHKQVQTRYDNVMSKIISHRTTYQRHKQYLISLTNALLASNIALRSAPSTISDLQALTQASLLHNLRLASHTFTTMIIQNKRLDKERDVLGKLDHDLCEKCEGLYKVVDKDCRELDRLHHRVLEAEKKMGVKSGCGMPEGICDSCMRNRERDEKRMAAEKVVKEKKGGSESAGKGPEVKGSLEDIFEGVELGDGADERV